MGETTYERWTINATPREISGQNPAWVQEGGGTAQNCLLEGEFPILTDGIVTDFRSAEVGVGAMRVEWTWHYPGGYHSSRSTG